MMAIAGAGRRPLEWWEYETEVERPHDLGDAEIAVFEMGELSEAEIAELTPQWRERYEQANAPGFSYCTGEMTWLKGEEVKQRLYRSAGTSPQSCGSGMPNERAANVLVYVASKAKFWPWWQALRSASLPIVASWIDWEHNINNGEPTNDEWREHSAKCLEQAAAADILLLYVDRDDVRHFGSLVEAAPALPAADGST
jgi:hypothetical protein